jgi:RNA polymerase sigma factor (sigma-70 family)
MIASIRTPLMHRLAGDDVLAARAGGGDDLAFATLVRRLQPRLLAYCATILGNVQDADDAVQNTFIKAHDGLRGGDHVLAVRPWLYRIAHNEAISLMRRRRPASELVATVPDHAHGPAEAVAVREEVRAVLHAIGELPDRSRDAFLLREVGGMRHAEVAEVLGTSAGTARQAVFEARVALQDDRAGRDASCHAIREEISARERRRASRTVRGHLRSCTSCRDWSDAQGRRREALGLAPHAGLPLAGAGGLWTWVAGLVGGGAATGGATVKIVASVAAVATLTPVGIGTLEREARRHHRAAAAQETTRTTTQHRAASPAAGTPAATPAPARAAVPAAAPAPAAGAVRVADKTTKPTAPPAKKDHVGRRTQTNWEPRSLRTGDDRRPTWTPRDQQRVATRAPESAAGGHGQGRRSTGRGARPAQPLTNWNDHRDEGATGSREESHEPSPQRQTTAEPVPAPADTHTTPQTDAQPGDDPGPPGVSGDGSTTPTQPVPPATVGAAAPGD